MVTTDVEERRSSALSGGEALSALTRA
jgi:hypothetical protein